MRYKNETMLKMICPSCQGNGYIGSSVEPEKQKDCIDCNSQGEVEINEKNLDLLKNGHPMKGKI